MEEVVIKQPTETNTEFARRVQKRVTALLEKKRRYSTGNDKVIVTAKIIEG